ncbi:MAG: CTP synthase [Candidatus Zambryskibacteria bacterium RIFCSPHIGHO2_02_FULL_43_14]|uniref:CTP synthase n=1 Tax=Candidatus Zambryskibacteria bacterium RIFCSPHIGHO2_02_FULL_43_14 TaxID=1802748 RepID=A0A1G2TH73_9BACT|nr:MAG: CTP synthase [Candidatus Zambryskibacteria bacterium RIFCSPHIGHO2_01_FULL_43_60]OHA96654.1 MAG: CTP synthase [Candidatus Zambryskibacteria bacterium RIFCSPHIGHO2_02_FULL_43_14]OHB04004.1 MAG: CTP synthase [Candidatus Zambryskibacteria bacterium RIFCSPLOWO2_01_FULL_42_41]
MRRKERKHRYIFVVGGVMSGVGKGVATSSIGTILQSKGFKISLIKADPYLNVDAGTMNPVEHGEVFVLDSGLETDQDMGNYERFLNADMPAENYLTNGMVFKYVIDKERALGYNGKCVEPVYHITEEILNRIKRSIKKTNADFTVFEIGGTIGEYQNAIFLEATRLLKIREPENVMFVMVSYLPVPGKIGEMKTKLTQNAIRQLNSYGIQPDMVIARSEIPIDQKRKEKIAVANGVSSRDIIAAPDIESIYEVPINFERDGLSQRILGHFGIRPRKKDLIAWRRFVSKAKSAKKKLKIAVIGKYFDTGDFVLSDAYVSVIEAIKFSSYWQNVKPELIWINSKEYETGKRSINELRAYDGVIVPGGFGTNGVDGILGSIKFVRENKIPYLGLCYGMQLAVVEYARNKAGLINAHTTEINKSTKYPVIDVMKEQKEKLIKGDYGGSMRLGAYPAVIKPKTLAHQAYGTNKISERHRHRFEVNPEYIDKLTAAGMIFSGISPDGKLCEIVELPKSVHPFFLATQFHPEFKARPLAPHPLFTAFIQAAIKKK